jgi:thioredoxin reductase/ferredoxin
VTWVVPLALVGLAVAVMAVFTVIAGRRGRHPHQPSATGPGPRILVHDINDDRCTGCDACVAVCPTNVLDLVDNKSRVLRFHDCIQCEACMWACPTEALVMFPEGHEPPPLRVPELDASYQTAVPGQYLIGEVAGKPLVKNAANLGRAVVEHMLATGLRPGAFGPHAGPMTVDVAIVGSGPGGLSAALTCIHRGLTYVMLEKEQLVASTISRYPKGKLVMAEPYDTTNLSLLPVFDSSKEQILPIWTELIERVGLHVRLGEAVESVTLMPDRTFDVRTTVAAYRAQRVVLATGTRGKPRTLQVPGENLPKVSNLLDDPDEWRGREVIVVGGGDSAVEAALALADAGARVMISYRGKSFTRAQPKNRQAIEGYAREQRLKVRLQSQVLAFEPDAVVLQLGDGAQKRYSNDGAFVLIGADPPVTWLEKLGVRFVLRPHQYALGRTDELVRRVAPQAGECPQDAATAAAVITGRAQERAPSHLTPGPDSVVEPLRGPRKWVRAATSLISGGHVAEPTRTGTGHRRLAGPMPLSEFAKRQHTGTGTGTGHGPRDALSAGERTRVLRMLRDEGGRIADEDSRVAFIDMLAMQRAGGRLHEDTPPPGPPPTRELPGMSPRAPAPSEAPPRGPRSSALGAPADLELPEPNVHQIPMAPPPRARRSAPMTAPPPPVHQVPMAPPPRAGRSAPVTAPPPPVQPIPRPPGDIIAKPAVIELGPGVKMKPGRATRPPPEPIAEPTWTPSVEPVRPPARAPAPAPRGARPPPFLDAPTQLAEQLPRAPERPVSGRSPDRPVPGRSLRRAPPPGDFGEPPTRAAALDPALLAASARARDPLEDTGSIEDPTRAAGGATPFAAEHDKTSADFDIRAVVEHARRRDPDFDDDDDGSDDVLSATRGHGATGAIDLGPREQSRRYRRLEDEAPIHDAAETGEHGPFRRGRPPAADEETRTINAGRPTRRDWPDDD